MKEILAPSECYRVTNTRRSIDRSLYSTVHASSSSFSVQEPMMDVELKVTEASTESQSIPGSRHSTPLYPPILRRASNKLHHGMTHSWPTLFIRKTPSPPVDCQTVDASTQLPKILCVSYWSSQIQFPLLRKLHSLVSIFHEWPHVLDLLLPPLVTTVTASCDDDNNSNWTRSWMDLSH